jgi:transcriptional regulator with XRE-family HTH domain
VPEEEPDRRACESCGCPLSRYNRDTRCANCQRSLLDLWRSMPAVPAHVWADNGVRAALASWDFGAFCRLLRQCSGLRQEDLAHRTGLSQGFWSQLESGERHLTRIDKIVDLLDGLDTPLELLPVPSNRSRRRRDSGIGNSFTEDDGSPLGDERLDPLVRLNDLSQVAERVRRLTSTNVDDDSLSQLHGLIREYAEAYEQAGARGLYDLVLRQRQDVDALMKGHHSPRQRSELFVIAGRLTVLLTHLAFDLDSQSLADAYGKEAWILGQVCGNHRLLAQVRSAQSFIAYYRREYPDALAYAVEAVRYAGSEAEGVQAAVHETRAHARLGDGAAVDRAIGRAFELRSWLTEPDTPQPFLAFEPYDTARIAGNAATAYLSLSQPDRVAQYAEMVMPVLATCGAQAGQALTQLDAASAQLTGGSPDPERAAAYAGDAVQAATGLQSAVLARRASEFLQLTQRWHRTPTLASVVEQICSWLGPQPLERLTGDQTINTNDRTGNRPE